MFEAFVVGCYKLFGLQTHSEHWALAGFVVLHSYCLLVLYYKQIT